MHNYYENSWELYKAQTETFVDDYQYYLDFCSGYLTLDLFAGFGRLTNFLHGSGVKIEAVELEENFAKLISIPKDKVHVCNVLDFTSNHAFNRVIAGFNSFCLFTSDYDIRKFFSQLSRLLLKDGKASLSYYHHNFWTTSISYDFDYKGIKIHYEPKFDLSMINDKGIGVWIDTYKGKGIDLNFKYVTKIYESVWQVEKYLYGTDLFVEKIVKNFGVKEPNGWVEFVISKR